MGPGGTTVRDPDLLHHRTAGCAQRSVRKRQIDYPTTFEKTVAARQHFHTPARGRYGIAWNGGRGMADRLDVHVPDGLLRGINPAHSETSLSMGVDEARGEQLRPQIQSDAGLRVLDYLHKLKTSRRPTFWNGLGSRTTSFLSGQTALAYCWTVRAARFETDVSSAVKRKVSYLPQPRGPAGASNNPIGGFCSAFPRTCRPSELNWRSRRSPG